jgi:predicted DNA-binding transcriptional regulator
MNIIADINKCQDSKRIKIYPDIMLAAARGKNGGAVRLFFLAKHFNAGGCGTIPAKALRRYVIKDLKVKRGTYDIWLARAAHIGIIQRQGKNLKLAGYAAAAVIVGCDRIGRGEYMPLEKFIKKGWLGYVWAAWIKSKGLEDRPISRRTMRELSGIPERTQRLYDKQAGIKKQANYAKDTTRPGSKGMIDYINEFEQDKIKSKAFLNNGEITWRLPNCYKTKHIEEAARGRLRRINSQLKDLLNNGGRDPESGHYIRRYCKSDKQVKRSQQNIRRLGNKDIEVPDWIYQASNIKGFLHAIPA